MSEFLGTSCRIHHNGKFCGECSITAINGEHINIDIEDIFAFAAFFIRIQKMNELENKFRSLTSKDILLNQQSW